MNKNTVPVLLAFLCMGFGDAAGQLVSIVEQAFGVSPFTASLVSFSGMIMFGLLSVPAGVWQSRVGKKRMLVAGLLLFLAGALLPVAAFSFPVILAAVLFMGAGAAILQVSGNPMMRDVSDEGRYSSNLSFAQAVKAIGTLSTSLVIALVGTSLMRRGWFAVVPEGGGEPINAGFRLLFPIFAAVLLVTLLLVLRVKAAPKGADARPATLGGCLSALRTPYVAAMVAGIFLYCGAEASMFNRIPSVLVENAPGVTPTAGNIVLIVAIFVGRFLGGVALRFVPARVFLAITVLVSAAGNALLFCTFNAALAWAAFALIGLGFANIFPLIFSICIDRYPSRADEISGLMTTAIVGAAIVPLLTGAVATVNPRYAFLVTLGCLAYVLLLSFVDARSGKSCGN